MNRHEAHVALPHYHFRLTTTGVFAKISYFRVEILEKRKKFQEAADAIKQILSGNCFFPDKFNHRRGKLWIRLILNLQHVNAKPDQITEVLEIALKDTSLNEVNKAELEVRMEKFLHKGALGGIQLEGFVDFISFVFIIRFSRLEGRERRSCAPLFKIRSEGTLKKMDNDD